MTTVLAIGAIAAPSAMANDAYEPNDSVYDAAGPVAGGQNYAAVLPSAGDSDAFSLRSTGGRITVDVTVTRDGCPDTEDAVSYSVWEKEADGDWRPRTEYGRVASVGSASQGFDLAAGDYALLFSSPLNDDTSCTDRSVDYNFTVTGAIGGAPSGGGTGGGDTGGGDTGGGATSPTAPRRLKSRPAFRKYACLRRSNAYTGFAEPPFKFTLKRGGVWIDRSFKRPIKARWKWRKQKLTLYSRGGKRLHTFAHFRDSSGKYLRQHPVPRNNNPLICR